jgi:hypothetical protein
MEDGSSPSTKASWEHPTSKMYYLPLSPKRPSEEKNPVTLLIPQRDQSKAVSGGFLTKM